jgi:hypothetical protein
MGGSFAGDRSRADTKEIPPRAVEHPLLPRVGERSSPVIDPNRLPSPRFLCGRWPLRDRPFLLPCDKHQLLPALGESAIRRCMSNLREN